MSGEVAAADIFQQCGGNVALDFDTKRVGMHGLKVTAKGDGKKWAQFSTAGVGGVSVRGVGGGLYYL
ncbi:hypothetical protein AGMMS50225_07760 [Betaproteobacteria bacterium]|nr:hypothetical protein AGMMS50225_07760 [Betaproteobacteria bacterium]